METEDKVLMSKRFAEETVYKTTPPLNEAVANGFYELIREENYPDLASLGRLDVLLMIAMSQTNKIQRIKYVLGGVKDTGNFTNNGDPLRQQEIDTLDKAIKQTVLDRHNTILEIAKLFVV